MLLSGWQVYYSGNDRKSNAWIMVRLVQLDILGGSERTRAKAMNVASRKCAEQNAEEREISG